MEIRTAIVSGVACGEVYRSNGLWRWDIPQQEVGTIFQPDATLEDVRAHVAETYDVGQRHVKFQERAS